MYSLGINYSYIERAFYFSGDLKIAQWLYSLGTIDRQRCFPLLCYRGHTEVVRWLITQGINKHSLRAGLEVAYDERRTDIMEIIRRETTVHQIYVIMFLYILVAIVIMFISD
jgi:hypothetical protein